MIHDPDLLLPSSAAHDVLAERARQLEHYGHDAANDDLLPRCTLAREAHVRMLLVADLVSGKASPDELRRARRKAVQAAALVLAEIDRIDRDLARRDRAVPTILSQSEYLLP